VSIGFAYKVDCSLLSVLSALLAIPNYSNRVWLYIRSTTALFGSGSTWFCVSSLSADEAMGSTR